MTAIDLAPTVAGMRVAQRAWADAGVASRAAHLTRVRARFAARADEIARVVCEETQKAAVDAWFADIVPNVDLFTWWTGPGLAPIRPQKAPISKLKFPSKRATLRYEPRGIIGLITPWNYPVALPLRSLVPALMAGNAVLFKPSEVTPKTGALIAEVFNEVLPGGVLTVVQGRGDAGEAVVDAADHVIFTGSVATGRRVALRCAEQLKPASLELGGKDAAIVFADCDLARTIPGIFWGAVGNSGQNCAAIERIYVERRVADEVIAGLVALAGRTDIAPVATDAQDALVRRHLTDATQRGATLHGQYPGAVIVTGAPPDALILQQETFGPVVAVVVVDDGEYALTQSNGSSYGLTTSLWTQDLKRAEALAAKADTGVVTINNHALTGAMPFAPWSGRRLSGHGVTNSHLAILDMVQPKFVLTDAQSDPEAWWHPFDDDAVALARTSLAWLTARGLSKVTGAFGVIKAIKKRVARQKRWASSSGGD